MSEPDYTEQDADHFLELLADLRAEERRQQRLGRELRLTENLSDINQQEPRR